MRKLLTGGAMIAALAFAAPAMAAEKPVGMGHCAMTAQGECINKDPPAGWNEGQPWACQASLSGGNDFWYVYWTNGEYWWVENLPVLGNLMMEGCDGGGLRNQFVYVINTSTGAFDQVQNRVPGY